jgi:hypothetical protein
MSAPCSLRVSNQIPADAVAFMRVVSRLSPEQYQALLTCLENQPANLSGYEKIRQIALALGHSKAAAAAFAAPLPRQRTRPAPGRRGTRGKPKPAP